MSGGQYGLLKRQAVSDPFAVVALEEIIELDHPDRHQPDHPSEMPVAPLGDPAVPVILAGLIDRWVQSGHGNQLVVVFEVLDLTPPSRSERLQPSCPQCPGWRSGSRHPAPGPIGRARSRS